MTISDDLNCGMQDHPLNQLFSRPRCLVNWAVGKKSERKLCLHTSSWEPFHWQRDLPAVISNRLKNPTRNHIRMPIQFSHFGTGSADFPTGDRLTDLLTHQVLSQICFSSILGQFIFD